MRSRSETAPSRQQDRELVAPDPSHSCDPLVGECTLQPAADLDQCCVARGMAVRVVDLLEAVNVDDCERTDSSGALGLAQPSSNTRRLGSPVIPSTVARLVNSSARR